MDHIKQAIEFANQSQAVDFKSSILSALSDKIADVLALRKMEIGSNLLNYNDNMTSDTEEAHNDDYSDAEENVDEDI